jgi:iron complex outermembrane recepter protein
MAIVMGFVRFGIGLAMVVGLVVPSGSWAQAAKGKAAPRVETEIEEITVTAQKREESLQETPISVTALTSQALRESGVRTVVDLGQVVPNLRITANTGGTSSTTITLRGLQQGNPEAAFQPKVGLYVDGVYISKIIGSNLDLEDLERVEVLRGPQGTLYGRNTIGGAVNFITKKPTEERAVTLNQEVGNYETSNTRLTINVPLVGKNGFVQSDALGTLSLRTTAGYKTHAGFYRNALPPGAPASPPVGGGSEWGNQNRVFVFGALRWQPTQDLTVDYLGEFHRYHNHPNAFQLTFVYPGSFPSFPQIEYPPYGLVPNPFYAVPYILKNRSDVVPGHAMLMQDESLHPERDDGNHRMHALSVAWHLGELPLLGDVSVKSISSYRSFTYQDDSSLDGTPLQLGSFSQMNDTQHWSEELQWVGAAKRFNYVLGAYYYGEYAMQHEQNLFFGVSNNLPYKDFDRVASYAPYGQITWTPPILGDKLNITAGLRYTQEQVHMTHIWGKAANPISTAPGFIMEGGKSFGIHGAGAPGLSPMGDISYQWTDDLMTYARVSRGFTGGGFTPAVPLPELFRTFKPETLWAFEAGFKSQWLDNRLRINADGFFSYYNDLQVSVFHSSPTLGAFSIAGNADRAEIWGMEFEGAVVPFRGLEATVAYSFIAPKYTKWLDQKFDPVTGNPLFEGDNPVLENVADKRAFPFTPNHQISGGLTYTAPPTRTGIFSAHLDAYWQDKIIFIANNQTPGAQADEGWAYVVVNGRLAYTGIPLQVGTLDLAVFARNLLDRKYRTHGIDFGPGLGFAGNQYGNPRTFGLSLTYNFSAS